jgi:hypothetical protein
VGQRDPVGQHQARMMPALSARHSVTPVPRHASPRSWHGSHDLFATSHAAIEHVISLSPRQYNANRHSFAAVGALRGMGLQSTGLKSGTIESCDTFSASQL